MNDMAETTKVKSDQINAADLFGSPITVTVREVRIDLSQDQPVAIHLMETPKVFRPCKIMRRAIMEMWGNDARAYAGRSMTLYCDPTVRFGKDQPGGTRISHMSHVDGEKVITTMVSKGKFAPHKIKPLVMPKPENLAQTQTTTQPGPDYAAIAKQHARKGKDAFVKWWNSEQGKEGRAAGLTMMDDLKKAVADADAAIADDPFGLPPLTDTPTPDQRAAAEAAAMATAKQAEVE